MGTERVEYRVLGDRPPKAGIKNPQVILGPITEAEEASKAAKYYTDGGVYFNVRLQTRTVVESDWEDVEATDAN